MANRFWVGGSGTWDGSTTTNWSTTSGGSGGASVPGTGDNVFFDSLSGGGTCTTASGLRNCADFSSVGYTGAFAVFTGAQLVPGASVYLGCDLPFIVTHSGSGGLNPSISCNGFSFLIGLYLNYVGPGGGNINYTLMSDLKVGAFFDFGFNTTTGTTTLNANGFNVNAISIGRGGGSTSTNPVVINMGSGTWTCTPGGSSDYWEFWSSTNLTINASTSTIVADGANTFKGYGFTYNNFKIPTNFGSIGNVTMSGANTFNNVEIDPTEGIAFPPGVTTTVASMTLNGTSTQGIKLVSSTPGSTFTLSVASGTVLAHYATITDSIATGGATFNAVNSTNGGNNTGWNFIISTTTGIGSMTGIGSITF